MLQMDNSIAGLPASGTSLLSDPIETRRALLVWRGPLNAEGFRERHVVGELWEGEEGTLFRYLDGEMLAKANEDGFTHYLGLPLNRATNSTKGIDILFHRIIPKVRPDYEDYLNQFGLSEVHGLSRLSLLAYTGARLTRDSFAIYDTFEGFEGRFSYVFTTAGYLRRWREGYPLQVGHPISFVRELDNRHDANAVRIVTNDSSSIHLGYINKLQSEVVSRWLECGKVTGSVYRNFSNPFQPELYVRADVVTDLALTAT